MKSNKENKKSNEENKEFPCRIYFQTQSGECRHYKKKHKTEFKNEQLAKLFICTI